MLNQTQRLYKSKSKSKIFLIILCIFGLLFSYSCSCKNRVTGPGNDGLENGKITNNITPTNNVDPKVFTISTNSVETRLVQKADGSGFNYQPSIKFSEANNNGYEVTYEVTDNDAANKIEKANITYNEKDGLITFDKTTVLDKLTTSKKSITITFTISATNNNLTNPTTNFTLDVDLKKTQGTLDAQKVVGKLFKDIFSFTTDNFTIKFETEPEATQIVADVDLGAGVASPKEASQKNFDKAFQNKMKEKAKENNNDFYKSIVLTDNYSAGDKKWSFNYKFTFSDEDYDLTDDQKQNGIEYVLIVAGKDGSEITWIDK